MYRKRRKKGIIKKHNKIISFYCTFITDFNMVLKLWCVFMSVTCFQVSGTKIQVTQDQIIIVKSLLT